MNTIELTIGQQVYIDNPDFPDYRLKGTIIDHALNMKHLWIIHLEKGFWSLDKRNYITFLVTHQDNIQVD